MSEQEPDHAQQLADYLLNNRLPRWAEGEECGIYREDIIAALKDLNLKLTPQEQ